MRTPLLVLTLALFAAACGNTHVGVDGGEDDGDAGITLCQCCGFTVEWRGDCAVGACDGYCNVPRDAGPIDAGPIDAGPIDAGPVDAGPIDAAPPVDAGPRCPPTFPADGEACTRAGLCGYISCDDYGVGRASCDGSTFTTTTEPCGQIFCRNETCEAGQYCQHSVGGAFSSFCLDAPEGAPLTCEGVCGAGGCQTIAGESSDPPEVFVCDACPGGGCP